jgi:hypothetical protein
MARSGRHKPPASRRRRPASRGRSYFAIGTGLAVIGGGVVAVSLVPHHSSTQALASDCGLVTCTAPAPSPALASITASASPSPSAKPHRTRRPRPRHTPRPRPHRTTPKPVLASPAAPATQPAGPPPTVTVTYALVQKWKGGFQGQFVITNHGGSWLSGWHLVATLPGDEVTSASGSAYQASGDTVTFDQALLQGPIEPGGSLTLTFSANGTTTRPSGCSFNGSACAA